MRIERADSFLVENIQKVMVFFGDGAEVDRCIREHGACICSHLGEGKLKDFCAVHSVDASKCGCLDEGNFWCFELWIYFSGIGDWCCQRGGGLQGQRRR